MPALNSMVSLASSPIVILPPSVIFPVTSKSPEMFTLSFRLISPLAALILTSPDKLSNVFPLIRKLPMSIRSPFTKLVLPFVLNVIPLVRSTFKELRAKFTVPLC